jgi:hypothetical protein
MSGHAEPAPPASPATSPAPPPKAPPAGSRGRSVAIYVLLVLAALLLLLSAFAVWVNRVALNTDVFSDTSTELIEDDAIRQAVATRAVDELFESVDVQAELEGQLPTDYQRLSGPATAALREASYRVVDRALEQPRLQRLWASTVEQSHRTLVAVLEGDGERVSTEDGVVTLDLELIVLEAADRIGLREQVADNLPENVGRIEVLRSDELDTAQDGFQVLKALAWVLPVLTLLAFALAAWIARDRRRAVRRMGICILLVGILGLLAANLVGNYIVNSLVSETENEVAAGNAWDILTELLRSTFRWMIPLGIVFVVASWLAGPGRRALAARRLLAPSLRERAWAYVGLAVLTLVLLLTGPVGDAARFLVVAVLVALGVVWIEVMRAQTMREFPGVSGPELMDELRRTFSGWWEGARGPAPPQATEVARAGDLSARLAALSRLHRDGELTDAEYAAAKARVLAGE